MDGEVLFFLEDFDEEAVEACEDVPVDVTEVVAWDVGAVILELDAFAAGLGAAFTLEASGEAFSGVDVEAVEGDGELGSNQFIGGTRDSGLG